MSATIQVHIGDQHYKLEDPVQRNNDWVDGSIMTVWDEFRALLFAGECLMGPFQEDKKNRGAASTYPQFDRLRKAWFNIRRKGNNTIIPTDAQLMAWYAEARDLTTNNSPEQQITKVKYNTYNPTQWNRETDKAKWLYIVLDRDITKREMNTWGGKYTLEEPETDDSPMVPEHMPKYVDYDKDLVVPGHVRQKTRVADELQNGTKDDIRNRKRIIDIVRGRPDTIIKTRIRENGIIPVTHRIDAEPVKRHSR